MDLSFEPLNVIMTSFKDSFRAALDNVPNILMAIAVLFLTLIAARILRFIVTRVMKRTHTRNALVELARNLIGIASWILGIAIAATVLFPSITPAEIIAGLGLGSVAIGFAFKDVFENFLAGIIILAREKMRIGDVIECESVFGRIENIQIRETHIRDMDGELIIVPNAYLFQNPVDIQTDADLKRQDLVVGVDYDADLPTVRDVLTSALETCETVDTSKETEVACINFGGSSIDFKLLWWTDSQPASQRKSYDEVAFAVKAALDNADIGIPFPQTTLSFRPEAQPVQIKTNETASDT